MTDYNIDRVVNVFHRVDRDWKRDAAWPGRYDAVLMFVNGSIEYHFPDRSVTVNGGDCPE